MHEGSFSEWRWISSQTVYCTHKVQKLVIEMQPDKWTDRCSSRQQISGRRANFPICGECLCLSVIRGYPDTFANMRILHTQNMRILHTQKAYTHTGTSSHQILLLSAHVMEITCSTNEGRVSLARHNMHEQVAKSLVYALAGGTTCMSVRLFGYVNL